MIKRNMDYMDALFAPGQPQIMPYLSAMMQNAAETSNGAQVDYEKAYAILRLLSPISSSLSRKPNTSPFSAIRATL